MGLPSIDSVRSVLIYHVLYGSLLVCFHHVVNKDCRLLPSAPVAVPVVRIHCTLLFAFIASCCSHSLHPVARIHRALLFAFIASAVERLILASRGKSLGSYTPNSQQTTILRDYWI